MELYADDCSIFLQPSEECLRYTIHVLDQFYKLSGLKISVQKTKAIWFGKNAKNRLNLCPDLSLDWAHKFKLLGVEFDNNLEEMNVNYELKLKEMKKILDCWMYRALTVYGKITVIKTLVLSKVSHLALVLPNLST